MGGGNYNLKKKFQLFSLLMFIKCIKICYTVMKINKNHLLIVLFSGGDDVKSPPRHCKSATIIALFDVKSFQTVPLNHKLRKGIKDHFSGHIKHNKNMCCKQIPIPYPFNFVTLLPTHLDHI